MANQLENIAGLQSILETVNSLPEAGGGGGGGGVANVTLNISGGINCRYLGTDNVIVKDNPKETIETQIPNMIFLSCPTDRIITQFTASSDTFEVLFNTSYYKLIAIYGDGSVFAAAYSASSGD